MEEGECDSDRGRRRLDLGLSDCLLRLPECTDRESFSEVQAGVDMSSDHILQVWVSGSRCRSWWCVYSFICLVFLLNVMLFVSCKSLKDNNFSIYTSK